MTKEEALAAAIEIVGGAAEVARQIGGLSHQAVSKWTVCPAKRVLALEAAVQRAIRQVRKIPTKHDLRPDLYPLSSRQAAARISPTKTAKKPHRR